MRRFFKIFFLISIFLLSGCNKKNADTILKNLEKKLNNATSYYVEGVMEIRNNEDTYTYDVEVSYQKSDYYKIDLVNNLNNHEQVILRNDDGVYVVTPSLNKSFKFQSDWPYNNSQVYLISSILEDLMEDEDRVLNETKEGYCFTSSVNYPNNKSLVNQNVYLDESSNLKKVEVVDDAGNIQIMMTFNKIEYDKKFDKDYFELSSILKVSDKLENNSSDKKKEKNTDNNTNDNTNNNSTNNDTSTNSDNDNTNNNKNETSPTVSIDDVIYPMYLPDNTYLTNKEVIETDEAQRLILTFGGDSSFVLVEEVSNYSDNGLIIPVSGNFDFLADVIGIIGDKSLSWYSNGIEYYMVSDTLEASELIEIARSVSVLPVSK